MSLDHPAVNVKHQTPTHDAFVGGRLLLAQPWRGFRAGLDSVLLGAAAGAEQGALLDLGAGVGTAGLVALTYRPGLVATLAERDPDALALLAENIFANGMERRAQPIAADVIAPGAERLAAGLQTDHYAAVIANPPYFSSGEGTPASARGRAARHMGSEEIELWVRTAAASAAPGGEVIFIHAAEALAPLLAVFAPRFGAITLLPLSPRPGAPVSRFLIRGIKGSRAPLSWLANRVIHGENGRDFSPEIDAILKGQATLVW